MDRFGNKTHGNVTGKDTPCEYVILMDEDAEACMPPLPIWQNSIMMVSGQTWYQSILVGPTRTASLLETLTCVRMCKRSCQSTQ